LVVAVVEGLLENVVVERGAHLHRRLLQNIVIQIMFKFIQRHWN